MSIPKILIDHIKSGQIVLFLGAGATFGAKHSKNISPPIGPQLAKLVSKKYLDSKFDSYPLAHVVELAISETDLLTVQEFIYLTFKYFYPSEFHKLIPKFFWHAIATTNFDLIIERAYTKVPKQLQELVVFKKNGERVENKIKSSNSIIYYKLHGCITDINDPKVPLILTPDQYVTHREGRSRLFERIESLAYEFPFLFVGSRLDDYDIRSILLELAHLSEAKPRSFLIKPGISDVEARFWETKKITAIDLTFKDFLEQVDSVIPEKTRVLSVLPSKFDHPIFKRFFVPEKVQPSESLMTFLSRDVEFIHKGCKAEDIDPQNFYKGYFTDWSPIINNLDVKRCLSDNIISEVFLVLEEEKKERVEFYVLKGHAGSGKTVILRRISWDASVEYDRLCLSLNPFSNPDYEPLLELYTICKKRIFLFIDPVSEFIDLIERFIQKARKDNLPLTIIGAERHNEWNISCECLDAYLTDQYKLKYLSEQDIEGLINLLSKHKSLGHLKGLTFEQQKDALSKKAGRQLLVALHEATLGKPFSDIVLDEYKSIKSLEAQSLYLTVCILHYLGVYTRAGLISRVHGIPFTRFKEKLFKPLEFIVFAQKNDFIMDYVYRSRHAHIAEIVIERVLTDSQNKLDEIVRILKALDIDYSSDREGFSKLTNAKKLAIIFSDKVKIRSIYDFALGRVKSDPFLFQQKALFEMNLADGDLDDAEKNLQIAYKLAPKNTAIAHSLSEFALKKAERSRSDLEKKKYRKESRTIARKLISAQPLTAHPFHTIIKIGRHELEEFLEQGDDSSIECKISEIEKAIERAIQLFPGDSFILDEEAKFATLINEHPRALSSLRSAFSKNKNPYLAARLAKLYLNSKEDSKAIQVLKECLDVNPNEKFIHYRLAMVLMKTESESLSVIKYHLNKSFMKGDKNYSAQFWYARCLYLDGNYDQAYDYFNYLRRVTIDIRILKEPRGKIKENGDSKNFGGSISKVETSYAFIFIDGHQYNIFTHQSYSQTEDWKDLKTGRRVTFHLAFNYFGPVAINVQLEGKGK